MVRRRAGVAMRQFIWPVMALSLIFSASCGGAPTSSVVDQCLRVEIFKECLGALPPGPEVTRYNDWDEVVQRCSSAAYYQSKRERQFVQPVCRDGGMW